MSPLQVAPAMPPVLQDRVRLWRPPLQLDQEDQQFQFPSCSIGWSLSANTEEWGAQSVTDELINWIITQRLSSLHQVFDRTMMHDQTEAFSNVIPIRSLWHGRASTVDEWRKRGQVKLAVNTWWFSLVSDYREPTYWCGFFVCVWGGNHWKVSEREIKENLWVVPLTLP